MAWIEKNIPDKPMAVSNVGDVAPKLLNSPSSSSVDGEMRCVYQLP